MKRKFLAVALVLLVLVCVGYTIYLMVDAKRQSDVVLEKLVNIEENPDHDSSDDLLELIILSADGNEIEFPDLYKDFVSVIPEDKDEKSILSEKLKAKGFKITNWGRGNFPPHGPRIINIIFKRDSCECEVSKMYYSTTVDTLYEVKESVRCRAL